MMASMLEFHDYFAIHAGGIFIYQNKTLNVLLNYLPRLGEFVW